MNPILLFSFGLLILASSASLALNVKAQTRSAQRRPSPVKVVPHRAQGESQSTSNGRGLKETESCVAELEKERPEASFCFSAADLICPDCKRGNEISAPLPYYPEVARAAKVSGQVVVEVVIDESGKVAWARIVKGHPLLRVAALRAACQRMFEPYTCSGRAVKVVEHLVYDFKLP